MIKKVTVKDIRYKLEKGAGSDAIHQDPVYSYAATILEDDSGITGCGLAFTLGQGNDLVCKAAEFLANTLVNSDIEELMNDFGRVFNRLSNEQQFRWLGPHKGIVHLALASVTNACYDLWAKKRKVPLWKLLIDLSPEQIIKTLDLSFLEDELTVDDALQLLRNQQAGKESRKIIIDTGYPGYDTSVGWFNYDDEAIKINCRKAIAEGFTALKLKVGSKDAQRDIRRANIVREIAGDNCKVMVDANQQWTLPQAMKICKELTAINPFWIEEPTHPDDILAHKKLA